MKAMPTTMHVELPVPPMPIPTTSSPTAMSSSSKSSASSLSSSLRSKLSQKKPSASSQPALLPPTPAIPRRNSSMHFLHKKQTAASADRNSKDRDYTELYDDGSLPTYPPPPPKEDPDDER